LVFGAWSLGFLPFAFCLLLLYFSTLTSKSQLFFIT
jgi:hypothetical protein